MTADPTRTVQTVRIGGFAFVEYQCDLSSATARIEGEEIILSGVLVRDKATQHTKTITVRVHWVQDLQSLGIIASSL